MSCNCGKNKKNCSCHNQGGCGPCGGNKQFEMVDISQPDKVETPASKTCSNKGKFFDKTLESFTLPKIGAEGWIHVCEATLWSAGQFVALVLPNSKIASLKITEIRERKIKVLNGCAKASDSEIIGNPQPGYVFQEGTVMYPISPTGCESGFASIVLETMQKLGVDIILEMMAESENVCFTNTPSVEEDETVHLFGGTSGDCECAEENTISSCLRKITSIITGLGGRVLCFKNIVATDVDPEENVPKTLALFSGPGNCLKKGPTLSEIRSCSNFPDPIGKDFNALIVCREGTSNVIAPTALNQTIVSYLQPASGDDPAVFKWRIKSNAPEYAKVTYTTSANTGGGNAATPSKAWYNRGLNTIASNDANLISLANNIITILLPGVYKIDWTQIFQLCGDYNTRLINVDNTAESYVGIPGRTPTSGTLPNMYGHGSAYVKVETTKRLRLDYIVETAGVGSNELGHPFNLGVANVFVSVDITKVADN